MDGDDNETHSFLFSATKNVKNSPSTGRSSSSRTGRRYSPFSQASRQAGRPLPSPSPSRRCGAAPRPSARPSLGTSAVPGRAPVPLRAGLRRKSAAGPRGGKIGSAAAPPSQRARPGFEPGTSRTRSENHTPRPTSRSVGTFPAQQFSAVPPAPVSAAAADVRAGLSLPTATSGFARRSGTHR
ncbi:PREDICTED: translation initiation factor IF-2-like [Ficedula albicollis]|uniref:translation initiation factor IF-2-like n=1 Tax=Ficedula albicollis TaxID=59894 RepID=UPI0007AD914F|nr:PREDICTED: translation initiation factor IF-2-like [Ficedula albicollis]